MEFEDVVLAGVGIELPAERWTSEHMESMLEPLYQRLRLPEGRLAMMSGILSRRVWPDGTLPSGPSARSVRAAMASADIDPNRVGVLIHASVCRDFLEPATASRVHHEAGLPASCWVYDVSNACLGVLNGAVQIAALIQSGVIDSGVVVGTENSRPLLQTTVKTLNEDLTLTRRSVKPAFASLTIGSGSCAWLLTKRQLAPDAPRLRFAIAEANTRHHDLCLSDQDTAGASMAPLMETDSETLMAEGIATGVAAMNRLRAESRLAPEAFDRSVCHQVGSRHRSAMLAALGLSEDRDVITFPGLGNTGSVALPLSVAAGMASDQLRTGQNVVLCGIGSGINSVMIAAEWGKASVGGQWHGLLDELALASQKHSFVAPA
ncbi:MAG: 3-oxoacyl-ACP synthase III [Planctomycetota bacterium]